MEYYYVNPENVNTEKQQIYVEGFEYRHIARVLRKKEGDKLSFTDGNLNIHHCKIEHVGKDNLLCSIESSSFNLFEPAASVNLFIAPLKSSERFEFAVEKAVELGIKSIRPVQTEFTVSKGIFSENKLERLRKIIIRAMCQSQRCYLPEIGNLISFEEMISLNASVENKIAMYEFSSDSSGININSPEISLLIGPEGGFSQKEADLLKFNKWLLKSLGSRKLRAETAAVVSVFKLINNYESTSGINITEDLSGN